MPINDDTAKRGRATEPIAARIAADMLNSRLPAAEKPQSPGRSFRVSIFHHDHAARSRAIDAFDHIGRHLNLPGLFDLDFWRFAFLEDCGLRREAARLAADADMIFLSLHSDPYLPPGLRVWFVQWAMQRGQRPCLLVASFDERDRYSASALNVFHQLIGIAAQGGHEVMPHFDFTPAESRLGFEPGSVRNSRFSILPGPHG